MRRTRDSTVILSERDGFLALPARFGRAGASDDPREPAPPPEPMVGGYLTRIPVRSLNRIVIVQVADILRLEAEDNYVRIWADRPYLHKDTLTGLVARLDPARFLRVHRSHAVNVAAVRELRPMMHGEYVLVLADGTEITSGRSYRARLHEAFGLGRGGVPDD
jgi:two-component system, LytTR family, response regulator